MNTISTAFQEWTRQVNNEPGTVSLDDATNILQIYGPTLTDLEGDAWWNAVAVEFERLGIITPGTYVGLRNWANNNEQGANDLFDGLITAVNLLPESAPVNAAIQLENSQANLAEIDGNIATIEAMKTGGSSVQEVQLDAALDQAINALEAFRVQLNEEINSATP